MDDVVRLEGTVTDGTDKLVIPENYGIYSDKWYIDVFYRGHSCGMEPVLCLRVNLPQKQIYDAIMSDNEIGGHELRVTSLLVDGKFTRLPVGYWLEEQGDDFVYLFAPERREVAIFTPLHAEGSEIYRSAFQDAIQNSEKYVGIFGL